MITTNKLFGRSILVLAVGLVASGCATKSAPPADPKLAQYQAAEKLVADHLATFDKLDYVVFTQPMPIGDGKSIPPTGKPYKITMCTVGHWKDAVMDEEYLFWDNLSFMQQIGLTK